MLTRWISKFLTVALVALPFGAAQAQDEGLYDAPLKADAAFVRFVGFNGDFPTVFDQPQPQADLAEGGYGVLSADASADVAAGLYYTIIPDGAGGAQVLTEEARADAAKVTIQLLNLTGAVLSLKVADGSVPIIEGVAANNIGARAVNPIKVPVRVFDGDSGVGEPVELLLQRGNDPTFVVTDSGVSVLYSEIVRTDLSE